VTHRHDVRAGLHRRTLLDAQRASAAGEGTNA
jgi:hypothetical protein